MKDEITLGTSLAGAPKLSAKGEYKFEFLDENKNVVHEEKVHNLFTDHYQTYLSGLTNYYKDKHIPSSIDGVWSPAVIAIYEDASPAVGDIKYRDYGTFRGSIHLNRDNSDQSHELEGNRTLEFWKSQRIDAKTEQTTYVGEFGTATANGVSNKIRMFGASSYKSRHAQDYDSKSSHLVFPDQWDIVQMINSFQGMQGNADGMIYLAEGTEEDEWTSKAPDNKPDLGYTFSRLLCANHDTIALPLFKNGSKTEPKVMMSKMVRGSGALQVPSSATIKRQSADIVTITLPSKDKLVWQHSAATMAANGDYYAITYEDGAYQIHKFDAEDNYSMTVTSHKLNQDKLHADFSATLVGDIIYIIEEGEKGKRIFHHLNIKTDTLEVSNKTITTHDLDPFERGMHGAEGWYDSASDGYILISASTDYSGYNHKTAARVKYTYAMWLDNSDNITSRNQFKGIGVVGGYVTRSPSHYGVPESMKTATSYNYSRGFGKTYETVIRRPDVPSTSLINHKHTNMGVFRPDTMTFTAIAAPEMSYLNVAFLPCVDTLMSEAVVPEFTKTSANSLRVTYTLTITES